MTTFDDLDLSNQLRNSIEEMGFTNPTPIQEQAFSVVRSGKDVVGIAQTGTGKTFAYMMPILRDLKFSKQDTPRVLVLVPTRELVIQVVEEIEKLASNFPENIVQFNVMKDAAIVAGATMFISDRVAHVQYISANEDKQQLGSLDFLFHQLITSAYREKKYFDFGVSNENQGKNINKGLQYWKECFGARSVVQEFYEVNTANHTKLDSVFI